MKLSAKHLVIATAALGLLALFYFKTSQVSFADHERFDHAVRRLQQLDATFNQDVLKVRFHLLDDYDGFAGQLAEMQRLTVVLGDIPMFIREPDRSVIHRKVDEISSMIAQKSELVESFKSQNAVFNNSLRYFPGAATEWIKRTDTQVLESELAGPMNDLIRQVLVYNQSSSENQIPGLKSSLGKINEWRARHQNQPAAPALTSLIAHVNSIIRQKPAVETLTRELLSTPIDSRGEELHGLYEKEFSLAMGTSERYRLALLVLCGLLVSGIGYTIFALDSANAHLDVRVRERTQDLSVKNSELQTEISERQRVEEKFRSEQARMAALQDASPLGTFLTDAAGACLYTNRTCETITGFASELNRGNGWWASIHRDDLERVTRDWSEAVTHGRSFQSIFRFQRPDGVIVWASVKAAPVLENGIISGYIGTIDDITERQQASAFLASILENLPIMVFIKEAKDLRFVMWNKTGEKLTGFSSQELLGKNDHDCFPKEQADRFVAVDRATLRDGQLVEVEEEFRTPDNGIRLMRTRKIPILDQEGQPLYLLGIAEDITEQKRAEAELKKAHKDLVASQRHFSSAFEHAAIGMALVSPTGSWLRVNQAVCDLTGYPAEELILKTFQDITHPDDLKADLAKLDQVIRGEIQSYQLEKRYYHKTGRVVWVLLSVSLVRDEHGQPLHFISQIQDISQRKQAEAEVEKTSKDLIEASRKAGMAEVATSVLHNVGNVLNSVNVATTCLADSIRKSKAASLSKVVAMLHEHEADLAAFLTRDDKGKKIPGYLSQLAAHLADEQTGALKELAGVQKNIEHIKDIVAMQQSFGKVSGVKETLKVTDLIEDALRINSSSLCRHDVQVVKEFVASPVITTEKHKVMQILVNLVRNAKQSCDESGQSIKRMTVRVTNGQSLVRISVSDNGVGIPPENLIRIFSHGFTTKTDGHGFGLHSGALAARELGGSLKVHSDGVGTGATFTVELPLEPAEGRS